MFIIFQDAGLYLKNLIPPVLTCFYDQDSRVRYYACEALYNIAKVARGSVLPFFNDVFDGLSKVSEAVRFNGIFGLITNQQYQQYWSKDL